MGEDLKFSTLESLEPLGNLLNETVEALQDKDRTILTSGMPEVLGAAVGLGAGAGIGVAAVSMSGVAGLSAVGITSGLASLGAIVGGGMLAGIAVAAAPAVLLGGLGLAAVSAYNSNELAESKQLLLQEVLQKHDAILGALRDETDANQDRLNYLNALNIQLQCAIKDLQADLAS